MPKEYLFFISIERFEKTSKKIIEALSQVQEIKEKYELVYVFDNPKIRKRYDIEKLTGDDSADIASKLVSISRKYKTQSL